MPDAYTVFMRRVAFKALEEVKGSRRKAVNLFIDYLAENPFEEGDFPEEDKDGKWVFTKVIRDYAITYYPDHGVKEVKILEINKTP